MWLRASGFGLPASGFRHAAERQGIGRRASGCGLQNNTKQGNGIGEGDDLIIIVGQELHLAGEDFWFRVRLEVGMAAGVVLVRDAVVHENTDARAFLLTEDFAKWVEEV
jgi:hypothetical protein